MFDTRDVFIKGKHVLLKVLTADDVVNSNWYGWFNDNEVTIYMQKGYYPNTKEQQMEFWESEIKGSLTKIQLGIFNIKSPDKLLGCVSLNNIDFINRKTDISTIIGEKEGRNINFFLEANALLIEHAFKTLNLRRIYGGTAIKEVADMMCKVLGFKSEGILREDMYKNNKYIDIYLIGLLDSEFKGYR